MEVVVLLFNDGGLIVYFLLIKIFKELIYILEYFLGLKELFVDFKGLIGKFFF